MSTNATNATRAMRFGRSVLCLLALLAASAGTVQAQGGAAAAPAPPQVAAGPTAPVAPAAPATPAATTAPAPTPSLPTVCVTVSDAGIGTALFGDDAATANHTDTGQAHQPACDVLKRPPGILSGSGDLIVAVDQGALETFRNSKRDQPGSFVLYLNGIPLPTDARLIASENVGTLTIFRYRVSQGKESQLLWSILYSDNSLFKLQPLHAALGWKASSDAGPSLIPTRDDTGTRVRVSTPMQLVLALLLVVLTVGVLLYIGVGGDSLRDAPLPPWWLEAVTLKATIAKLAADARDRHILAAYSWYVAANADDYRQRADSMLKGLPVGSAELEKVTVGLALLPGRWTSRRASYSLSRTQLALWFTFTVAAGLFLWMLYGDLRRIDGSLLLLLGISVGTAGASWIADRNMEDRAFTPSQGFLHDLLTGIDERKQLHRYQAVVINLLLLLVGVFHVAQQLSYPVFDASWLIFLGISGTAYTIGKGALETGGS